jgi:Cu2+-exporting ATPase
MAERAADEGVAASASQAACFHCGLAVPAEQAPAPLQVLGALRRFCCHGCRAVCEAIVDSGLGDYYRYRGDKASASQRVIPESLKRLDLYDRPDIQRDFVSVEGDWREASLLLENIRCPACLWLNERQLRRLPGVVDVHIDDATQRARVRWDPGVVRLSDILRAIARIGYSAHPYDAARGAQLERTRRRRSTERLIFAAVAGMFIMNFSLSTYLMGATDTAGELPLWETVGRWTSLLLSAVILAYPGQEFFAGAWSDLRHRRVGMDVPVVLGLSLAWLGSLQATLSGQGEVYFDSIAMFVFFLLLARRLELRGKLAAARRLDRLAGVRPRTARRVDTDGRCTEVLVDELAPGDRMRLLPGETLPVDATLLIGASSFDESLLTGEALPVLRRPGDELLAGAVNGEQPVTVRVSRPVQHSALKRIHRLVERGLEQRPRYALLADRLAGWFVVVLLGIAGLTAVGWYLEDPANWLANTIAVLIVTCPCALALATPVALAVSAGRFVELGVLPLRMRAVDALARADLFVFDKTGTLTAGQPALAALVPTADQDKERCLGLAASLSAASEHPIARALRGLATPPYRVAESLENRPGFGVRGLIAGREWRLGKPAFAARGPLTDPDILAIVQDYQARGQLVSLLSNSDGIQAVLVFEDPLRSGVGDMLAALKRAGVHQFSILSGDAAASVRHLGRRLGIGDCHSDMKPTEKLAWTRERQRAGQRVLMFGDGINDAPTLAVADVSVSFADATDLANSSSDFLILGNNGATLAAARRLARRTRRNILQNLVWAAGYNLIAVPFAAAGYIPPWAAAIGMSLSSLVVVVNASRLSMGGNSTTGATSLVAGQ